MQEANVSTLKDMRMTERPLVTGATAVYAYDPALEERFRFTARFGDEVRLFSVHGGLIHLPRALCPLGLKDQRVHGDVVEFPKKPEPRPHQVEVFNKTIDFLLQGQSGVVCAYTGFGKTVIGFAAAYAVGRKTLVITTKEDIFDQWIAGATKFLGVPPERVGVIRGDKCEVVGTDFVVALVQSLSKDEKYPEWITEGFGLVIFDECHRMPAEQFSRVVDMFPAKLRLGLSATPKRADGKELLVTAHVGPIRVATEAELMVPKVQRFRSGWRCPRRPVKLDDGTVEYVTIPHEAGKLAHIEKIIAADPERNELIARLIAMAREKGRKIAVFSTLHDHLKSIKRLCHETHGISGREMGFYVGATTKAEKDKREKEKLKPILFTTYNMMGEGTSIDWLDTAILAMPRANVAQPVGRIRREYEDKRFPVVMDVLDDDSPVLAKFGHARLKWFKSIGAEVKDYL
jgi:superfamily II DNA or RNA helicase